MSKKKNLRQLREDCGLTLTQAAGKANISYNTLLNWEKGHNTPQIIPLQILLTLYNATFEELDLNLYTKETLN